MLQRRSFKSLIPPDWPLDVQPTDESGEVDLAQIEHNLSLTPANRVRQSDRFARFLRMVRAAGKQINGGNGRTH